MKKHRILLSTVLLVLALGVLTPQFAQDTSTNAEKTDQERLHRALLVGLVRTINTAEVTELYKYGSYAAWQSLLAREPEYWNKCANYYSRDPNAHFGSMPEILPGYSLRLNVHAEGQGYDLRLEDTATKQRSYAAFSDESGAIWQGEPL